MYKNLNRRGYGIKRHLRRLEARISLTPEKIVRKDAQAYEKTRRQGVQEPE